MRLNTSSEINEGDDFMATCENDLPQNLVKQYIWLQDDEKVPDQNTSQLTLEKQIHDFKVSCKIDSLCGKFMSDTMDIDVQG